MSTTQSPMAPNGSVLLGHPAGLFTLFFAEMWERFSYYGMRALLMLYMVKGFLTYGDKDAIAVYGAYTALVYMAPFFGGMLADRLLGARRSVVLGGLLMAAGQAFLTVPRSLFFFTGLALLICGNGFFKPNISTIVGSLYPKGSPKRDGGFTIFYMGINLGAAMSPLLCAYIGETYGWSYGFGLAGIGMLVGVAVFVAPTRFAQGLISIGAVATAVSLFGLADNRLSLVANIFVGIALLISAGVAMVALERGGVPAEAGAPPDQARLRRPVLGPLSATWLVYLGTILAVGAFVLLVSGFAPLSGNNRPMTLISEETVKGFQTSQSPLLRVFAVVLEETSRPAGLVLVLSGLIAAAYIFYETFRLDTIPRQRMYVVLILTFFSMLFWSFFEQAGSSVNNFTDRNVDRVVEARTISAQDVGQSIVFRVPVKTTEPALRDLPLLTQEQIGHRNGDQAMKDQIAKAIRRVAAQRQLKPEEADKLVEAAGKYEVLTMTALAMLRDAASVEGAGPEQQTVRWVVVSENVGMGVGGAEIPASSFQAANPVYILLFGLVFSALWSYLGARGLEPSTTFKFALGLLQLGLGFVAFWYAARTADPRGMTAMAWLFLGYLLHTTGELCLSPVGLSMVTKLSPSRLVSTVMGVWFLATAFSQLLAAIIAQFTGVTHGDGGGAVIPPPSETCHVYGEVFGKIALGAIASAAICFALAPVLNRWMHPETEQERNTPA
ncbi:MAG: oligopeptide:H+ symporter [Thermoguttaceae bacterium]|jgi:POT family proton-dependent oligopeptide transporter|nr:oligopeptide:H+ symporter [Thermoguttaceae bacterium]